MPAPHPAEPPTGPAPEDEYQELQRGQEAPLSVETLQPRAPQRRGTAGRRVVPVPPPGERPGAIRLDVPPKKQEEPPPAPAATAEK